MTCHKCGRFDEQSSWPDGQYWCRVVFRTKHHSITYALCNSCCKCKGRMTCSIAAIMKVADIEML